MHRQAEQLIDASLRRIGLHEVTAACIFLLPQRDVSSRVLARRGMLIVASPTPTHLRELIEPLGLVRVDPSKGARLQAQLSPCLQRGKRCPVEFEMELHHDDVRALVGMGPTAHHLTADEIRRRTAQLPEPVNVTASVTVEAFARRAS